MDLHQEDHHLFVIPGSGGARGIYGVCSRRPSGGALPARFGLLFRRALCHRFAQKQFQLA